ncbi:MAG: hypothetical protein AAF664_15510 [Planctomycetota bacterium]
MRIVFVLSLALIAAGGCGTSESTVDDHGHEHAHGEEHAHGGHSHGDGHEHGESGGHDHDDHDHTGGGHAHGPGPHGGTVADWGGGKYHVELTIDHDQEQATIFVLGSDEKTPNPISAESIELAITVPEMLVSLKPAPIETDADGSASRFIGGHELLATVKDYSGTMTGMVNGTPYSGDFEEHSH